MTLAAIAMVMDTIPVPVFVLDEDACYLYLNPAAEVAVGYEQDEISGLPLTDLLEAEPAWVRDGFEELKRAGHFSGPVLYRMKGGGLFRGDANVFMRAMPDGTRVAVSIVYPVAAGPKSAVVQRVDLYGLTGPEVRLLQMLAAGLTDSQIAGVLESNQDEVVRQMSSMLSKMGVASRTAGAVLAIKHHLVL